MKNHKLKSLILLVTIALLGIFLIECNQSTAPVQQADLEMSVVSSKDTTDEAGILVLTNAKLLLKDIMLNLKGSGDSTNFQVGPFVIFLNLNTSVQPITKAYVPGGIYQRVRFMIHKLNDNEPVPDSDFVDINGRYSVIVRGVYNGIPFIYKSTKSAHQIITFTNDVTVSTSVVTNITLAVKPYEWFIKNGVYMDPTNPANMNDIDNNIKNNINNNFRAFKDDNRDGIPD